jgi:hypothetical protein
MSSGGGGGGGGSGSGGVSLADNGLSTAWLDDMRWHIVVS